MEVICELPTPLRQPSWSDDDLVTASMVLAMKCQYLSLQLLLENHPPSIPTAMPMAPTSMLASESYQLSRLTTCRYCMAPDGSEVLVVGSSTAGDDHDDHDDDHDDHDHEDGEEQEMDCHFHAGVEYAFHLS